ncbi:MAG: hypothetical protein LJE96_18670 [Deltaproteobacteria bacterium]|nr:hypothetical protein [Deltaproteobacteria bacterium]
MNISELLTHTLLLDLETTRTGRIRRVGAVLNGNIFEKNQRAGSREVLKTLDGIAESAAFILGHNLLGHDFPILKAASPRKIFALFCIMTYPVPWKITSRRREGQEGI